MDEYSPAEMIVISVIVGCSFITLILRKYGIYRMQSKESVFKQLQNILVELFEVDANDINLGSRLYEDLDIDSIDAVDMIVKLKELTGKRIEPSEFKNVRTVEDIVDAVHGLIHEPAA